MSGKNKGLGRGLDLIFEDNFTEEKKEDAGKIDIPMILLDTNPNQPRKSFSEEELRELAQSIEENGLVQPVVVRKKGERYELIAGERRFRAFKLLGRDKIPAVVTEADDLTAAKYSLIENLQREDLNPYEEAAAYRTLIDEYGLTQEEAAAQVGKSRSAVANSIRLLDLPEDVLELLVGGELSAGHGRALLMLNDKEKITEYSARAANGAMTVRQLEDAVRRENKAGSKPKDDDPENGDTSNGVRVNYLHVIEERVTGVTGRRCKITDGKRGVKTLSLEYRDDEDLEEMLRKIAGDDVLNEL
jgi:ParB family transcriptional regulator, chromosome partitioning protein